MATDTPAKDPQTASAEPAAIGSKEEGYAAVLDLLKASQPKGAKVLDAPAGHGALTKRMQDLGYEVAASDIFPDLFCVEGVECRGGSLNDRLPYDDDTFDGVTSCNGIHRVYALGRCIAFLRERGKSFGLTARRFEERGDELVAR